ncbi:hypothetical protein [Nonomuraea sp. JJY05]|jgi:hypothetical protein|uniref:hypothetical protein n=1 Tax=Nonomuraea sp. JJY05 TaxID=3350255 RepID=UPI00373F7135
MSRLPTPRPRSSGLTVTPATPAIGCGLPWERPERARTDIEDVVEIVGSQVADFRDHTT